MACCIQENVRLAALAAAFLSVLLCAPTASAGPPFVTDDPDPGKLGEWEVITFGANAHALHISNGAVPGVEYNFTPLEGSNIAIVMPMAIQFQTDKLASWGPGDIDISWKQRLVEQGKDGWPLTISVVPAIDPPSGDPKRDLGTGYVHAFFPIWAQRTFGDWTLYGGGGYWINPGPSGKNYWFAGAVLMRKITDDLALGVELNHELADSLSDRDTSAINLGGTYRLNENLKLYSSIGRGIQNAAQTNKLSWYCGLSATGGGKKAPAKPKENVSRAFSEWSGFYVGAGAALSRRHVAEALDLPGLPPVLASYGATDVFGGPFAGVNWRLGQLVIGGETEVDAADDLNARRHAGATLAPRVDAVAWSRGRIGLPVDRFLFFGAGGAAAENFFASAFAENYDAVRVGWTVGGGFDYALDENWAARVEFRHADFGSMRFDSSNVDGASARWRLRQNALSFGALYRFEFLPPGLD